MRKNTGCLGGMLAGQKKHISFHTPGHKRAGTDITELSYSDNLMNPTGVIRRAEEGIAELLHAERSFLLTDGSTAGVFSMIYALKSAGVKKLVVPAYCHASVKNACLVTGVQAVELPARKERGIPAQPSLSEIAHALDHADALLLTSPDYYGFFAPLEGAKALCRAADKPFVVDGAHGAHLHFTRAHAGFYCDMWVDGAHKSLPALTQGAVVSANGAWTEPLWAAVRIFRTSSPSYPIMASVENAVRFPRNEAIERAAEEYKKRLGALANDDWTKIVIPFGKRCDEVQSFLEERGVFAEFNDGNYLMFYLSPCTKERELKKLAAFLKPFPRETICEEGACTKDTGKTPTWVPLNEAVGRVCAQECGLFPPCVPLIKVGEKITQDHVQRLLQGNAFGLREDKICVYAEE